MKKYIIRGGRPLIGEVGISGGKNAALAVLPATLLVDGVCRVDNLPGVSDVTHTLKLIETLGAKVRMVSSTAVEIDGRGAFSGPTPYELVRSMRASYYLVGALLSRFGSAEVAMPGGDDFGGVRPIDQHIKGFEALGAEVEVKNGLIHASSPGRLRGRTVYLDIISVGATINIMLAAVLAEGITVIENAAREPHVVDLANFINMMGGSVSGAGTMTIKIRGVKRLSGGEYTIIPDQIEAGTFMAVAAATGGDVLIKGVIPKHLEPITAKLCEMGAVVEEFDDSIRIVRKGPLRKAAIKTLPYPGFPTDIQSQFAALLCTAAGPSTITEGIWESRFRYVDELRRMGAKITVDGKAAVIEGGLPLTGAPVKAFDLRAGAALVIAGLMASGTTEVTGTHHIERGYENFVEKLRGLGADIQAVDEHEKLPRVLKNA
jgi:UDP-N-acetylglucosamine 1-carboxyvinyltransferase